MPMARIPVRITAPSSRAPLARAYVAVCGSRWPSPATYAPPNNDRGDAAGIRASVSSGERSSTSSPIPLARLTPRCSSMSCSRLEASRTLPTAAKTPSSRYSSMLYRRNRIIVGDGLNWVTSPAAWHVDPLVSSAFSKSRTSLHPALAR